jgi:tetratricopeptide (TPR) repeat protein/SAM-dependent methyltransferase
MNRHQRRAEKKQARSFAQGTSPAVQSTLAEALRHHQAGRLREAEQLYRQNLAIDPRHADSLHLLGMIAYQAAQYEVAANLIAQAIGVNAKVAYYHSNLGLTLSAQGKLDAAVACFRQALALEPNYVEACNNLGNALKDQGKLDEAIVCFRRALVLKPDLAELHNNLGNALNDQGKLDEAISCFRRALVLKPDFVAAHSNLGNALRDQRKFDEAVSCYHHALALKQNIAEVHNNLGNALRDLEKLDEAAACYGRALEIQPAYPSCLNNLALLLMAQGDVVAALKTIKQSLQIGETADAKGIFVECVKNCRGADGDREIEPILIRAMNEPWCRPGMLASAVVDLVKRKPNVGDCISRAASAWPGIISDQDLYGPDGFAALSGDELLKALLCSTPIADIAMERFLTTVRRLMLEAATNLQASDNGASSGLDFYSALARHCFINEYVFCHSDAEIQKASALRVSLTAALEAGTRVPALWLLAVGAYFPLFSLPCAARMLETEWAEPIASVLTQQIREPEQERQLRAAIPRLTGVDDKVSKLVQRQYEENPYPRWVKLEPAGPSRAVVEYLRRRFPAVSWPNSADNEKAEILIAGCGTGQQSIGLTQIFKNARVLAVDLSLSSLSYAVRKTQELGLTSIEYAQADLLELGSLNRQFNVIASVGVLHHLADPFAGWQVLLSRLRPGGFMNLGFYSEAARRNIVAAQNFAAEHGYDATADNIRLCRQQFMTPDHQTKFGETLRSSDFYSVSTCRDLLFHAQEHQMTLTAINWALKSTIRYFAHSGNASPTILLPPIFSTGTRLKTKTLQRLPICTNFGSRRCEAP